MPEKADEKNREDDSSSRFEAREVSGYFPESDELEKG